MSGLTPSQTVGPFFRIGFERLFCDDLVPPGCSGEALTIAGQVLDADGQPVPDAVIEFWQADQYGRYICPKDRPARQAEGAFSGWARIPTDALGGFRLRTVKPGAVSGFGNRLQAPHINVAIFMRGLLRHLFTRIYFGGDPANQTDAVLSMVPEHRRSTLAAKRSAALDSSYSWNIVLQGPEETVFFDW
jgi:protocatechuate 3,4-dioxygenase, alpha subunit